MPTISFVTEELPPLTKEQEAVVNSSGNVLIKGGPGTGKTRTMTDVLYHTYNSLTKSVLGLTFSRVARWRWVNQVYQRFGGVTDVEVRTFHSFARTCLGEPQIANEATVMDVLLSMTNDVFEAQRLKLAIDRYKHCGEELLPWDKLLYGRYEKWLHRKGLMDFNDLLRKALDKVDVMFDRVVVDEFQDTSMLQYELLKKIATEVVIMDEPFQRIYQWRDADERNVQRVQEDYAPSVYELTTSFRHTPATLEVAESLYPRGMTTTRSEEGIFKIVSVASAVEEQERVQNICKDGMPTYLLARESALLLPYYKCGLVKGVTNDSHLSTKDYYRAPSGDVKAMTMHSVKGGEVFRVIILGCNEGYIPHRLSSNYVEEKNLLYTAVTRAKNELYVITYGEPSRWLKEMEGAITA